MKDRVFKVVSQIMDVPVEKIQEDASSDTLERWDSLQHLNLFLALEEEFSVRFSDDEIVNLTDVNTILETIKQKIISR